MNSGLKNLLLCSTSLLIATGAFSAYGQTYEYMGYNLDYYLVVNADQSNLPLGANSVISSFDGLTGSTGSVFSVMTDDGLKYFNIVKKDPAPYPTINSRENLNGNLSPINKYYIGANLTQTNWSDGGALNLGSTTSISSINTDFISNYINIPGSNNIGGYGGALLNGGNITNLTGSFIGNYVTTTGANEAYGGAIHNSASSNRNGTITNLNANFIGNYVYSGGKSAVGGAILNGTNSGASYGLISNIDGVFINNYANGKTFAKGGAIYNYAIFNNYSAKIEDIQADFIGNYVTSGSGDALGGAIANEYLSTTTGSEAIIGNVSGQFIGNYVSSTSGNALGGAIYNSGTIGISDSYFFGNTANGVSNAIYNSGIINLSSSIFKDAITGLNGTINITGGEVEVANTISGNNINLESGSLNFADGNTIEHFSDGSITFDGGGLILDADLANNAIDTIDATSITGSALFSDFNIISDVLSAVTLEVFTNAVPTTILNATAYTSTAKYEITGSGGFLTFTPEVIANAFETARGLDGVRDFTLTSDYNISSKGTSTGTFNIYGNLANALKLDSSGDLIVDATNAASGSDVYEFNGQGSSNLVNSNKGILNLTNMVMTNGFSGFGGGLYNDGSSSSRVNITNSSFVSNNTSGNGGAISTGAGILTVSASSFIKNKANSGKGGAISNGNSTVNIDGSVFMSNSAGSGGAVANRGVLSVKNSTFSSNSAMNGGAINQYVQNPITLKTTIENSAFNNNSSTNLGGAIYSEGGVLEIINSTFTSNTSTVKGGAIHSIVGELNISGSTFTSNTSENGGAVRAEGISATISNTIFDGNKAISLGTNYAQGGAILNNTTLTLEDVTIKNSETIGGSKNARGGAIENSDSKILNIINSTFDNNKATSDAAAFGGAIYNNNGVINISATGAKNTVFSNNLQNGVSNAINNAGDGVVKGVVTFNSDDDSQIISYDTFTGTGAYYLQSGNLSLQGANAGFSGTRLNVSGGKISTIDDVIRQTNLGNLTLNGNLNYGIDVDLDAGTGDTLVNLDNNFEANGYNIVINEVNIIKDGIKSAVLSNNDEIKSAITLDSSALVTQLATVTGVYNLIKYQDGILYFDNYDLKGAVNSTEQERIYVLTQNEIVSQTLGTMGGTKLSVSGLNASGDNFEIISTPTGLGGIITSAGQTLNISDVSKVSGFSTTGDGGFINNLANLNIENVTFENNHANSATVETSTGGVVNSTGGSLNIDDSTFNSNTSTFAGGAVAIFGGSINNIIADFTENGVISTGRALGGALYLNQTAEKIEGTFKENYVTSTGGYDVVGGAIAIMTGTIKSLTADFLGNYVSSTGSGYAGGGAIRTYSGAKINIFDSEFVGNYVESNSTVAAGGAIFSHVSSTIIGTSWESASGAVTNVTDSNFFDNYVKTTSGTAQGGAVYLETISDALNVNATNKDVYFSGNYTQNGSTKDFNAVHLYAGKMSLTTSGDNQIIFNDAITAEKAESAITIAGNVVFNDVVSNTSISLNSGQIDINQYNIYNQDGYTGVGAHELEFATNIFNNVNLSMASNTVLNAINDSAKDELNFEKLTINGSAKISLDANLETGDIDTINATTSSGTLVLDTIKLITDSTQKTVAFDITDSNININADSLTLDTTDVNGYYTKRDYDNTTGILTIGRLNLAEVVALNEPDKTYTLLENEIVAQNLGSLVNNKLSIIGTGTDYIIDGQNLYNGITVGTGKTLSITDVENVTGFVSASMGGFIINSGTTTISGTTFSDNSASYAGGVIRNDGGDITITDSIFTNNFGGSAGSAILSNTGTVTITNSTLSNNTKNTIGNVGTVNIFASTFANNINTITTTNYTGGAINNYGTGTLNINKNSALTTLFEKNSGVSGGAISNDSDSSSVINNATFSGNSAQKGGAIYNTGIIAAITNSVFNNNKSSVSSGDSFGGAINNTAGKITTISATFNNNSVTSTNYAHGGGIYNAGGSSVGSIDSKFEGNSVYASINSSAGGAIFNRDQITSIEADFIDNTSTSGGRAFGGAIYNTTAYSVGVNSIGSITGSFSGNKTVGGTESRGGAIWNSGTISKITGDFDSNSSTASSGIAEGGAILNSGTINLFDSSFTNNTVTGATSADGGAIYNSGTLSITAQTENVVFSGNTANGVSDAIYNEGEVNFNSETNYNITSFDDFLGDGTYNLQTGKLLLNGANFATDSNFVLFDDTTLSTVNNTISNTNVGNLTVDDIANWGLDINISNKTSDTLIGNITSGAEKFLISELNVMGSASSVPIINITDDANLTKALALSSSINVHTQEEVLDSLLMSYNNTTGELLFEIADINDAFSLDIDEKIFIMGSKEDGRKATEALGSLKGDWLSISGNNYDIIGNSQLGGSVANDQILTLTDVGTIDGFDGNFINNSGDFNIKADYYDTTLGVQADINNNFGGVINLITALDKDITLNNDITGMGIINVDGNVFANGKITDNNISINSGIFNVGTTAEFSGVNINAGGGTLSLANNQIQDVAFDTLSTATKSLNLELDVKLSDQTADTITASKSGNNKVYITKLNILDDASQIESIVKVADGTIKENISLEGVDIVAPSGSTEDYDNGYFVGYSTSSGDITFSYANIQTAFSSSVEQKAYSMIQKDELITTALTLNGDSLSLDGNGLSINASDINVNGNALTITDATINSTITGAGNLSFDRDVTINSDVSSFTGVVNLNGGTLSLSENATFFDNNVLNISNTPTLNAQNGSIGIYNASNWNLSSDLNVMIDVNLVDETADSFVGLDFSSTSNVINISSIFITEEKKGQSTISITNRNGGGNFTINSDQLKIVDEIYEYQYNVDDSELESSGLLTFVDTEYKDFNPAIVDSIVAKQSQYLSSINVYKEAFANFGTQAPHPYRNLPSGDFKDVNSIWFRPFGKNEDVNLDNGYSVDNEAYGALFGVDSPVNLYRNCWTGLYSLYAGYMNSVQKYDDVKIEQDGFVFGFRALFERLDFFSGITANVSTSFADGNNMFGKEDFVMYSGGVASKTGYNFGFENNKYVVQPSLMLSYTYIHTPSYDNSSNIRISNQDLHALQITPEIKFIKNLETNRQVYFGANYNWNLIEASDVKANDIVLPNVSVDPYAEFRLGTSRKFENEIETFAEITSSTGGREGVGVELGLKWSF